MYVTMLLWDVIGYILLASICFKEKNKARTNERNKNKDKDKENG